VSATKEFITKKIDVVTRQRRAINPYYVYLVGFWIAQPRVLTFGGGAGAASGDARQAATLRLACFGSCTAKYAFRALRLPLWVIVEACLVFEQLFWPLGQLLVWPSSDLALPWLSLLLHDALPSSALGGAWQQLEAPFCLILLASLAPLGVAFLLHAHVPS
jgi:hypothetical protein